MNLFRRVLSFAPVLMVDVARAQSLHCSPYVWEHVRKPVGILQTTPDIRGNNVSSVVLRPSAERELTVAVDQVRQQIKS